MESNNTKNSSGNKKLLLLVLLVLGLLVAFLYYFKIFDFNFFKSTNVEKVNPVSVIPEIILDEPGRRDLPDFFVSPEFPWRFPFEHYSVIVNYVENSGSTRQFTRQYFSKKSLTENFNSYQEFLVGKGWKVVSSSKQKDISSFSATLGSKFITITLTPPAEGFDSLSVVDVTLVMPMPE